MKAKTKLFLYMLSWRSGQIINPSTQSTLQSFEGWAYQNGLLPQIEKLHAEGFLEKHPEFTDLQGVVTLTKKGMKAASGGRNPRECWNRKWDHNWHLLMFDLPATEYGLRKELLRSLKANSFGCLQGSVWISPTLPKAMKKYLHDTPTHPSRFIHIQTKNSNAAQNKRMVSAAWNFRKIEAEYDHLLKIFHELEKVSHADELLNWAQREWQAWEHICALDPMLPRSLHPAGYSGPELWEQRTQVLHQAGTMASDLFVPPETFKSRAKIQGGVGFN